MNLIIRVPNWIGDGIMCLPAIRALKKKRPDCSLTIAVRHYLSDIFVNIPEIDAIIPLDADNTLTGFFRSLCALKKKNLTPASCSPIHCNRRCCSN